MPAECPARVAVVTGGGRGLGRVVAVALARRGDRVALVGRGVESLQFLWIADPLQAPIPSWDPSVDSRPWN